MASVLERILGKREQREQARTVSYTELVEAIARGEHPDDDVLDTALDGAGKSATDLGRDVLARQQRIADAKMLTKEPELIAERDKLTREIDAITEDYAKQKRALAARLQPTIDSRTSRRESVAKQLAEIHSARRRLVESADPTIEGRRRELSRAAKAAEDQIVRLQDDARSLPSDIAQARHLLERSEADLQHAQNRVAAGKPAPGQRGDHHDTNDVDEATGRVRRFTKELEILEGQQTTIARQISELQEQAKEARRQVQELEAERLKP